MKHACKQFSINSIILCLLLFIGYQADAFSATGWCTSVGGPHIYNIDISQTLTNPDSNKAGVIISPPYTWDLGSSYSLQCECDSSNIGNSKYYAAQSAGLPIDHVQGETFYTVNQYIAISSRVWVGGDISAFVSVPFTDVANGNTSDSGCTTPTGGSQAGSSGIVTVYIKKPFVGLQTIAPVEIVQVFATKAPGSYSSEPVSRVMLNGTIIVPQSCEINDGQTVNINFGEIFDNSIKTKGMKPENFTAVITQLAYICTNISEGVRISFTFNGQSHPEYSDTLATTNNDIGIRIEDTSGVIISPNSGELSSQFDVSSQSGTTTFLSYPINATGNIPAAGDFSSTATIVTNME